jgi:thiol-disulfide isomerase/thioredoxin
MRYIHLLIAVTISQLTFAQQPRFLLKGKIIGKQDGKIYLITWNDDWYRIRDSAEITNGQFQFKGKLSGYTNFAYLKLNPNLGENSDSVNGVQISLENSHLSITLEYNQFSKYTLTGCKACDEYEKYYLTSDKINLLDYIKKNTNSLITPRLIYDKLRSDADIAKAQSLYLKLQKKQRNSYYGKQIKLKIQAQNLIGSHAINFIKEDINGNKVVLYELLKKNYVLLEFWGSWCNPCRAEHPGLKAIYEKYHNKGFEIIGIADDDNSVDKWKKAIADDEVGRWSQILRGKKIDENKNTGKPVDIGNMYFVRQFPTLILIGKNKKVIGKFTIEELEDKLVKLFN